MEKVKIAVLISGRGSNMRALIEACKDPKYPASIHLVLSNKEDAPGLKYAKENGIKTAIINHKDYSNRENFDTKVTEVIQESDCQLICLAGFMRILSPYFVDKWENKLINIHPSLLPSFKGEKAVKDALEYGVKYSGCTVHFVTKAVDSGEIIDQDIVQIKENDTIDSLAARILEKEHILYPRALEKVLRNK